VVDKLTLVDLQCNQAAQTVPAITLESEKDMQHIIEALARDMAEHLRPMVAEMVRQELANADGENAMAGIAQNIDLQDLAAEVDATGLAAELSADQLAEVAGEIDLTELAAKIDIEKLTRQVDVGQLVRDWLTDQTFTVRPY
jgi:hypothetical protein